MPHTNTELEEAIGRMELLLALAGNISDNNKVRIRIILTTLSALQSENKELRRDKERLDWLNGHIHANCLSSANEHTFLVTYLGKPEITDARLAIDTAISAQAQKGKG